MNNCDTCDKNKNKHCCQRPTAVVTLMGRVNDVLKRLARLADNNKKELQPA